MSLPVSRRIVPLVALALALLALALPTPPAFPPINRSSTPTLFPALSAAHLAWVAAVVDFVILASAAMHLLSHSSSFPCSSCSKSRVWRWALCAHFSCTRTSKSLTPWRRALTYCSSLALSSTWKSRIRLSLASMMRLYMKNK